MTNWAKYRDDLNMNKEMTISLPLAIWWGFMASYVDAEWSNEPANWIVQRVQEQILDPVWLKEREAMMQHNSDMAQNFMRQMMGQAPDIPPNMEEDDNPWE